MQVQREPGLSLVPWALRSISDTSELFLTRLGGQDLYPWIGQPWAMTVHNLPAFPARGLPLPQGNAPTKHTANSS